MTNARDEDIEDLLAAVRQLRRRHLVCVASLREEVIDRTAQQARHHLTTHPNHANATSPGDQGRPGVWKDR